MHNILQNIRMAYLHTNAKRSMEMFVSEIQIAFQVGYFSENKIMRPIYIYMDLKWLVFMSSNFYYSDLYTKNLLCTGESIMEASTKHRASLDSIIIIKGVCMLIF